MQRELKFRAWDAENSIFWHYDLLAYHTEVPQFYKKPVTQFTGCIDKNGKEIFEGDIVRDDTTNSIWSVSWNAEAAGWTDKQDNPYSYGLYKSLEKSMEVIGNIYENPEILEEA